MILPRTDEEFQKAMVPLLKTVCPTVREGVYTGNDVDSYITFYFYRRGTMFSNGRPTSTVWRVFITLWVKKGVESYGMRESLMQVIADMGGTYPTEEIDTEDEWKQYVYEFQIGGGVPWQK